MSEPAPLPETLRWLACPVCRQPLGASSGPDRAEVNVECIGCGRRYPIVDGIPVLLAGRTLL